MSVVSFMCVKRPSLSRGVSGCIVPPDFLVCAWSVWLPRSIFGVIVLGISPHTRQIGISNGRLTHLAPAVCMGDSLTISGFGEPSSTGRGQF